MSVREEPIAIEDDPNDQPKSPLLEGENKIIRPAERRVITTILLGFIGTLVGIIGHHLFLFILNGRPAKAEFWIKTASNAFSQVVVIFMGLIITASLIQSVWEALTTSYTKISVIDELFSLPSPRSILSIGMQRARQLTLPLMLSLLIQSLVAVSTLAPNSLTINPRQWSNITSSIPDINPFDRVPDFNVYAHMSGGTLQDRLMGTPLEAYWGPPKGCEASCLIQIQYQAPALSCRNLQEYEWQLQPFNKSASNWVYYNASLSLPSSKWGNPYPSFWINYVPHQAEISYNQTEITVEQTALIGGLQCDFHDGNYQATFELAGGTKSVTASIMTNNHDPVEGCSWNDTQLPPSRCGNYSMNANTTYHAFISDFMDSGNCHNDDGYWMCTGMDLGPNVLKYINEQYAQPNNTLSITTSDLDRTVEELYSNLTLAAILSAGHTKTAWILASDGQNVWKYTPSTFWIVYGIALGSIMVLIISNYSLIINRGISMSNEFVNMLTSTRNKDLDKLCASHNDITTEAKLRFKADRLRFDTQESFSVFQKLLANDIVTPSDEAANTPSEKVDISDNIDAKTTKGVHPDKWALIGMIAAYLGSVIFAVGHHIFLWRINKTFVSSYSQFWVKNISNAFSQAVSLCLGSVAAYSLTQTAWKVVASTTTSVAVINRLFSLPAVDAYFRLLISSWRLNLVPAALIVLTTYMLFLVSIFAPNALTIGTSQGRTVQVQLPAWNYNWSTIQSYTILGDRDLLPGQVWSAPPECEATCDFQFDYEVPSLVCTDYDPGDEPNSIVDGGKWNFIRSNFTIDWGINGTAQSHSNITEAADNGINNDYWRQITILPIWLQYIPSTIQITENSTTVIKSTSTPVGSLCRYQGSTYQAQFHVSNNTMTTSNRLLYQNDSYGSRCPWEPDTQIPPDCWRHGRSSFMMATQFAANVFQNVGETNGTLSDFLSLMSLGIVDFGANVTGDGTFSLGLKVSNISEYLPELFSNFTLNVQALGPNSQTVDALTSGNTIWEYDATTLWSIYGPAYALMFIVLLYGLYCVHENGMPLDKKFSTILITTRSDELDDTVEQAKSYHELAAVKLRYERKGTFVVVHERKSDDPH